MDESRKKILSLCAAFIAAPRLMFLDEESPFALRDALSDSIRKAEILLRQVDACYPASRIPGKAREEQAFSDSRASYDL
jgi:hypothetical protein